jgi:nucleotide-binding universal stress UspA family protein
VSGTTVVVGLDGSADASAALTFALKEAAMRRSSLRVVAAVDLPDYGLAAPTMVTPPPPEHLVNDVRKAAQTQLDQAVAAHGGRADGVPITVEAIAGHPG